MFVFPGTDWLIGRVLTDYSPRRGRPLGRIRLFFPPAGVRASRCDPVLAGSIVTSPLEAQWTAVPGVVLA